MDEKGRALIDQVAHSRSEVLLWCAILHRFDDTTLFDLGISDAETIRTLYMGGQIEQIDETSGTYVIGESARSAIVAELRRQRPRYEIDLHARALAFFVRRLKRLDGGHTSSADVERCLYHLSALHDLFVEYMEWNAIIAHLHTVRNTSVQHPRIAPWLEFYEAYTDLRTDRAAEGRVRLERLLERTDLEPALRLRALHACHIAYIDLSRYDHALDLLDEALRIARAIGDPLREGYLLLSIGMLHNDLEDYQQALSYTEQSLRLFQQHGAIYREAHALYEVGNNAMRLGHWDRAREVLDESAALYTSLGMTARLPMVRWAQGMLYQLIGHHQASETAYLGGLAIADSPDHFYPPVAMDTWTQLGLLRQTRGDDGGALEALDRAARIADRYDYRHYKPIIRSLRASLLWQQQKIEAAAAMYRAAIADVEALRGSIEIEQIRISLFGTTQYIYEWLVLLTLDNGTPAEAFAYMERARARAFLDLLAKQSPELYETLDEPTVTIPEVQARLGRGDLVLEFYTTGVLPAGDHWLNKIPAENRRLRQQLIPPAQTLIFAITRDRVEVHPAAVDPNKLRPSRHSKDPVLEMLRTAGALTWLYDRLIAPVEHLLADCRQLYLIPHGPLHYVPFTALHDADDRFVLHAGGPAVVLAPSATILLRNCLGERPARATRYLSIGYNDQEGEPLEHAEVEATVVAGLLGAECWIGPDTKSQRLTAIGDRLRVLHIAGHATFDQQSPLASSLRLGLDDNLAADTVIRRLKLHAELVTLSSCMSGFSRVVSGDELLGLPRAFLYAGTPRVVCTLAKTRDTVAVLVMEQLYTRLNDGMTPALALRDALVAVRSMTWRQVVEALRRLNYAPPRELSLALEDSRMMQSDTRPFAQPEYWAPFVLIGRP